MKILCVPIRLDALVATDKIPVIGAGADFSALPYQNKEKIDIHFDTANLISSIRKDPFRNEGALHPGVHLHWALPDALTHGKLDDDGELQMPVVPNRWLVMRKKQGEEHKSWIVESDYLHPAYQVPEHAVCIPYDKGETGDPPWRYLGRQLDLSRWRSERRTGIGHERYGNLHVLGWGNPWFSALYAECFSVFGCHDPEKTSAAAVAGITYDVFGWYADPSDDYLVSRLKAHGGDEADIVSMAESVAGWQIRGDATNLDGMICFGRVEFSDTPELQDGIDPHQSRIAMARTGGEAIATWLSKTLPEEKGDEDRSLRMENQIEAVLFNDRVRGENVDFINRLKTARHKDGFSPVDSGPHWAFIDVSTIGAFDDDTTDEDGRERLKAVLGELKTAKWSGLERLNALQEEANRASLTIRAQRRLLHADWTKYMLSRYPTDRLNDGYPDGDLIQHFIETRTLPELTRLEQLKARLDTRIATIKTELDKALEEKLRGLGMPWSGESLLRMTPGPRYWRAREPSLLISGELARPVDRHGQDGDLPCQIREVSSPDLDSWAEENRSIPGLEWDDKAVRVWRKTPWLPMFMEWRMALYPDKETISEIESNLEPYDPGFITDHYRVPLNDAEFALPSMAVDLQPRGGQKSVATSGSPNIVTGRTILTLGVKQMVSGQLADYLEEKFEEKNVASLDDYLATSQDHLVGGKYRDDKFEDPIYAIGKAREYLDKNPCLTQQLDGLHDEWLMQRTGRTLPVADPFQFILDNDASDFTRRVRDRLGDENYELPSPYHRFTPIRTGVDKLLDLRIIDTFGRFKDIPCDDVLRPQREVAGATFYLPPRLIQATRLEFRWLMRVPARGAHGVGSPILGWLVYNLFDETLVIHDAAGKRLGAIGSDGEWMVEPGSKRTAPSEITDGMLKRFVGKLMSFHANNRVERAAFLASGGDDSLWDILVTHGILYPCDDARVCVMPGGAKALPEESMGRWRDIRRKLRDIGGANNYLPALKQAIRRAQDNIDPEGANSEENNRAGRPLAIVRARLDLHSLGVAEVSKSWNALGRDLQHNGRSRREFTAVRFPIKIGEFRNLDDGVVGYWPEDETGELGRVGYFPQSDMGDIEGGEAFMDAADFDPGDHDFIDEIKREGVANLTLSLDDPPLNLTLLMEPDGGIHATTGILPKKRLVLEPAMYRQALSEIEHSFFAAPLLTPDDRLALPLPPDGPWLWRQRHGDGTFMETPGIALIHKARFLEFGTEDHWIELMKQGILQSYGEPGRNDLACYNPISGPDEVPGPLKDDWAAIEKALINGRTPSVRPLTTVPPLCAPARVVEGWIIPMEPCDFAGRTRAE
uniref:Uncharacterized protein n=1 Tax=Candidatus Kentrum sp. FW TaxID=2126338 RepID=A0A450SBP8_9GAMM|nr:MAG: hypothetical protein BECKFW1821A_GA0114235_10246 [Candidatus Kentron sp. FW]